MDYVERVLGIAKKSNNELTAVVGRSSESPVHLFDEEYKKFVRINGDIEDLISICRHFNIKLKIKTYPKEYFINFEWEKIKKYLLDLGLTEDQAEEIIETDQYLMMSRLIADIFNVTMKGDDWR